MIVTGASRGIGAAIASLGARRRYAVAVNLHSGESESKKVAADVAAQGGRAIAIRADISHDADILRMFEDSERGDQRL